VPAGLTLAQFALRWILMAPDVTCAIPGARTPRQVEENVSASDLPDLSEDVMRQAREVYKTLVRPHVHDRW
jgi:aryl-alcohol dehydrogenase-like predicted oxidoreductase